jgi:hypothetical protein
MSVKKENLKFKVGDLVKIDYSNELDRLYKQNQFQIARNNRAAIIIEILEKELIGSFNKIEKLYRYKVIAGREVIEIDQSCLIFLQSDQAEHNYHNNDPQLRQTS